MIKIAPRTHVNYLNEIPSVISALENFENKVTDLFNRYDHQEKLNRKDLSRFEYLSDLINQIKETQNKLNSYK